MGFSISSKIRPAEGEFKFSTKEGLGKWEFKCSSEWEFEIFETKEMLPAK